MSAATATSSAAPSWDRRPLSSRSARLRSGIGTQLDPHSCWMLSRSLETLSLRMERAAASAAKVAQFLSEHPKVAVVHYPPLLPSGHPARALMERQSRSAGSTFSFEVEGRPGGRLRVSQPPAGVQARRQSRRHRIADLPSAHHRAFRPVRRCPARDRDHAGAGPHLGRPRTPRRSHRRHRPGLRGVRRRKPPHFWWPG